MDNETIASPNRSAAGDHMVFGTPLDITLSEIALETFLPANAETAAVIGRHRRTPGTIYVGSALFGG